ncbi:MAG: hypothetical protein QOF51_4201 [Chloroflexota bacterium]|jgi:hypothetical protein|nr:hypothetical protein [Chloroflexota bacterium]
MATYMDVLAEDKERMRRGLEGLIQEQEQRVGELTNELHSLMQRLDQLILRTLIYRNTYGAGGTETMAAETDTEEASKPVTEVTRQLERERAMLKTYRDALAQITSGAPLEDLGKGSRREVAGAGGGS